MDHEKVKLIVHNMELLVQSLKIELEESKKESTDETWIQQYPDKYIDEYEPDYYEEED